MINKVNILIRKENKLQKYEKWNPYICRCTAQACVWKNDGSQGYEEPTGRAKITPSFNLPCSCVLHTVGPIVRGWPTKKEREELASCYRSCLELAEANSVRRIAFCCISTGEFHFLIFGGMIYEAHFVPCFWKMISIPKRFPGWWADGPCKRDYYAGCIWR